MPEKTRIFWGLLGRIAEVRSLLDGFGLLKIAVAAVSTTAIFLWSHARHYWGPFALVLSLLTFAVVLELCIRLPEILRRKVNVTLTPASGPAPVQFLNVKNLGSVQAFRAECTTLQRRNDHNPLHRSTFRLEWEGVNKRSVKLRRHGSCNLVIAAAGETKGNGRGHQYDLDWLEICGLSADNQREAKQQSTWSHGDDLPEYDLEISIVGDSGQKAYTQVFTVRPGGTAAIEMLPK